MPKRGLYFKLTEDPYYIIDIRKCIFISREMKFVIWIIWSEEEIFFNFPIRRNQVTNTGNKDGLVYCSILFHSVSRQTIIPLIFHLAMSTQTITKCWYIFLFLSFSIPPLSPPLSLCRLVALFIDDCPFSLYTPLLRFAYILRAIWILVARFSFSILIQVLHAHISHTALYLDCTVSVAHHTHTHHAHDTCAHLEYGAHSPQMCINIIH